MSPEFLWRSVTQNPHQNFVIAMPAVLTWKSAAISLVASKLDARWWWPVRSGPGEQVPRRAWWSASLIVLMDFLFSGTGADSTLSARGRYQLGYLIYRHMKEWYCNLDRLGSTAR